MSSKTIRSATKLTITDSLETLRTATKAVQSLLENIAGISTNLGGGLADLTANFAQWCKVNRAEGSALNIMRFARCDLLELASNCEVFLTPKITFNEGVITFPDQLSDDDIKQLRAAIEQAENSLAILSAKIEQYEESLG